MDRRAFLAACAATAVGGCLGGAGSRPTPGGSHSHRGLRVTVAGHTTASTIDGTSENGHHKADEQTTLLLVQLSAEHTGDSKTRPPWPREGSVQLQYVDDEPQSDLYLNATFTADGTQYQSWNGALNEQVRDDYLYPDTTVTGWEAFRVVKDFDPSKATVWIGWGEGESYTTLKWAMG